MSDGRVKLRIRVKRKYFTPNVDVPPIQSSQPRYYAMVAIAIIFVAIIFWFVSNNKLDQQISATSRTQFVALPELDIPIDNNLLSTVNEPKVNLKLRGLVEQDDKPIAGTVSEVEHLSAIGQVSPIEEAAPAIGAMPPVSLDNAQLPDTDPELSREKSDVASFVTKKAEQLSTRTGYIARALLTNDVKQREPVDQIDSLVSAREDGVKLVYFYTEFREMKGQTLYHHWRHAGKVYAIVPFEINGNRWRVYSSKRLNSTMLGDWQVAVLDEFGNTLHQESFNYVLQ